MRPLAAATSHGLSQASSTASGPARLPALRARHRSGSRRRRSLAWSFPLRLLRPSGGAGERADDALDEGLRHALIAHQLERARELAMRHVRGHARVLRQHGVEVTLLHQRLAARVLDDLFGLRAAD